jgi:hypothetical protein
LRVSQVSRSLTCSLLKSLDNFTTFPPLARMHGAMFMKKRASGAGRGFFMRGVPS